MLRGNLEAAKTVEKTDRRQLSVVTYMELLQGSRDRREVKTHQEFLDPISRSKWSAADPENIGHRAAIYMEEYGLKVAMCMADALLAATAVESQLCYALAIGSTMAPSASRISWRFRP